jgi:site-specific DNA recombinase
VRVSTEEQADEGFSIQAQLQTLRTNAKLHQYIIHDEYVDEGISGKSINNRPELNRLLSDAKKGLFEEVIVWKVNRISRSMSDLLNIADKLEANGIAFKSFSEPFDTSNAAGKFLMQMMGAVAELERNTIVDNVKMGMKQRAQQGKWNGGAALGYKSVEIEGSTNRKRKETKLIVVEQEAAIVQFIFKKYENGQGLRSIANELNHMGHKTKRGRAFSVTTIKGILSNPLYIGKIRFNKQQDWNTKRRKGTNPSPIIVDGEHEAIIGQELWNKVLARYANANKHPPRVYYGSFPFTGVMRCPQCGHGMVAQRATRKSKKTGEIKYTPYYQCGQFANKGTAVCRANSVRLDYAHEEIMSRLKQILLHPQLVDDVFTSLTQKKNVNTINFEDDLKFVDKELDNINHKREKYFKLFEEDLLPGQLLRDKLISIDENKAKLQKRKAELEDQLTDNITDSVLSITVN